MSTTVATINKTVGFPKAGLESFKSAITKADYIVRDIQQSQQVRNATRGHHCELADATTSMAVGRATAGAILLDMAKQPDGASQILAAFVVEIDGAELKTSPVAVKNQSIAALNNYLQTKSGEFAYLLMDGVVINYGRDAQS